MMASRSDIETRLGVRVQTEKWSKVVRAQA
jgi:hypothetical protein